MQTLQPKHPRAIRWFHWVNFPLLSLMIWSGLLIYWANDINRIGLGQSTLFHWFYSALGIDHQLRPRYGVAFLSGGTVRGERICIRAIHRCLRRMAFPGAEPAVLFRSDSGSLARSRAAT